MKKTLALFIVLAAIVTCITACELLPCNHKQTATDAAVAPTCTEDGLTEGSHCAKCGEIVVKQEVVPALGHTEVLDGGVEPTCTEDGLSAGVHCSVCNATIIPQESVPAAHSFTDWKQVVEADCFFAGEETRACKVCDLVESREVAPIAHSFVQSEEGELYSCELCGAVIYAGHLYAAFDVEVNWYDAYKTCTNLGGHLVTITSEGEQQVIIDIINGRTLPSVSEYLYWAGGLKNTDGWQWATGEEMNYTNWGPQGLDGAANNWHIALTTSRKASANSKNSVGDWEDWLHTNTEGFNCEWELDIVESEHYFTEWEVTTEVSCFGDGEEWRICTHCGLEETEVLPQLEHNFVFNEASGVTACEHCNAALYNGHIYKIFTVKLSWFDAYTYCNDLGGHLVTITSEEEQMFIETFMNANNYSERTWLGGYNDGNSFKWITGEEFEYSNWYPGQPDCDGGTGYFVAMNYDSGYNDRWHDHTPFSNKYFICEWEAE